MGAWEWARDWCRHRWGKDKHKGDNWLGGSRSFAQYAYRIRIVPLGDLYARLDTNKESDPVRRSYAQAEIERRRNRRMIAGTIIGFIVGGVVSAYAKFLLGI
ncbi:hypothetical protein SAMN05661077_1684 [Thiohalorhabdus denitrificans]|uniref:Uncharacterized protein n=1 Tax=Thiohalorhabdus denitrificans TaxID=381306 RepID=A0A1G5EMD6_9GAMM|nr:hypothetical protein SAMN05661077_1684 [Thiohalorhabdus denitrificans]